MSTSSTNIRFQYTGFRAMPRGPPLRCEARGRRRPRRQRPAGLLIALDRDNADPAAVPAVILESYLALDLGKQRVILAEADVQAGLEPPSLLPHQDRPAGDDHPVVALDAE